MNIPDPLFRLCDVSKEFPTEQIGKNILACNGLSFNIPQGKTFGIVGESGCGKSTLAKLIVQMLSPTQGKIFFKGENITNIKGEKARQHRKHVQMVFQDPTSAFNPKMLVRDIICEPLLNFAMLKKSQIRSKAVELLQLVGLPEEFADRYPHSMSGGQRQRVGIARALALEPEVIILDEATSALDVSIQKSIMDLLMKLQQDKGITYIFICHDVTLVNQYSDEIIVMYLGNIMEQLTNLKSGCKHPYAKALLRAIFYLYGEDKEVSLLEGDVPNPIDRPTGCPFHTRCSEAWSLCKQETPKLVNIAENHRIACHKYS